MLLVFKKLLFSRKNEAMTFPSSLVIYSLISYIIYSLVLSQTFISLEQTKLDNCVRYNLPLTEKLPVRGVALKYKALSFTKNGNILKNTFEGVLF